MFKFLLLASTYLVKVNVEAFFASWIYLYYQRKIKEKIQKREIKFFAEQRQGLKKELDKQKNSSSCFFKNCNRKPLIAGHVFSKSRILKVLTKGTLVKFEVTIPVSSVKSTLAVEDCLEIQVNDNISISNAETRYMFCKFHDDSVFKQHDISEKKFSIKDCIFQIYKIICSYIRYIEAQKIWNEKSKIQYKKENDPDLEYKKYFSPRLLKEINIRLSLARYLEKELRRAIEGDNLTDINKNFVIECKETKGSLHVASYAVKHVDVTNDKNVIIILASFPVKIRETEEYHITLGFFPKKYEKELKKKLNINWNETPSLSWADNAALQVFSNYAFNTLFAKEYWERISESKKENIIKVILHKHEACGIPSFIKESI